METVRDPAAGRSLDRRVRRTRAALTRALVDLVLAKRYRSITVQDLLDRADVGRSTFYSHYRGKDDLLLRSFEAMLEGLDACLDDDGPEAGRLAPVEELFRHVGGFRDFHRALVRARRIDLLFDAGARCVGRAIARRLPAHRPELAGSAAELEAAARACAGALFGLLRWWVEQDDPPSPRRVDELFHALLVPGLAREPDRPPGPPV